MENKDKREENLSPFWDFLLNNPLCLRLKRISFFQKIITKEVVLFVVFGLLTTAVSMLSFWIFNKLFSFAGWSGVLHLFLKSGKDYAYMDANVLSWVCAVTFAFITNKLFVFESKSWEKKNTLREAGSFFGARLFSLLVDEGLMLLFVSAIGMKKMWAKLIVQVIIVIINYVLSKAFVFRKKQ